MRSSVHAVAPLRDLADRLFQWHHRRHAPAPFRSRRGNGVLSPAQSRKVERNPCTVTLTPSRISTLNMAVLDIGRLLRWPLYGKTPHRIGFATPVKSACSERC